MFPGQGAIGDGLKREASSTEWEWISRAFALLGRSEDSWTTELAGAHRSSLVEQVAVLAFGYGSAKRLEKLGVLPQVVAGHSAGELTALVCADALTFEEGVEIAAIRGTLMDEAGRGRPGAMAAVQGADAEELSALCEDVASRNEVLVVANHNGAGELVVSGDAAAVSRLTAVIGSSADTIRAVRLNVAGAFHSPRMESVGLALVDHLSKVRWRDPVVPLVSSVDASLVVSADGLAERLAMQVTAPVRWGDVLDHLVQMEPRVAIDMGPNRLLGRILSRHASQKGMAVQVVSLDDDAGAICDACWTYQQELLDSGVLAATCAANENPDGSAREAILRPYSSLQLLRRESKSRILRGEEMGQARELVEQVLQAKRDNRALEAWRQIQGEAQ
jgi:[acyl-carrier-protein] S-malonyltransferase